MTGRARVQPDATGCQHVLIIEDDPATREPLAKLLQYRGYRVSTAQDGKEALAAVSANLPDLILTDLMMPHLGGVDFLQQLRRDVAGGGNVPVIVLTGAMSEEYLAHARQFAQHTLLKGSFNIDTLFDLVDAAI